MRALLRRHFGTYFLGWAQRAANWLSGSCHYPSDYIRKTVAVECLRLSEPRTVLEGMVLFSAERLCSKSRLALSCLFPSINGYSSRLGKHSTLRRSCRSLLMLRLLNSFAYWGDVNEAGNDHVRQEVLELCVSNTSAGSTSHLADQDCP